MKNTCTIDIAAPPARVFSLINDSESLKQWIPNLVENEALTSTDDVVGSTFHQVYIENGKRMEMDGRVVRFEQDKRLVCEINGDAFDLLVDYLLEETRNGTRLTQITEVSFKSLPMRIITTLLKPLVSKASQKQQGDQFAKLKALAESGELPPAAD